LSAEAAKDGRSGAAVAPTPYDVLGGAPVLRRITERFYDIMSEAPDARALRAMHSGDLGPMREKLFDFMSGWLGGPNRYFERSDRLCMGTAHAPYRIGEAERDQWLACMRRAMQDEGVQPDLRARIEAALFRMADMLRSP
jgi:hemoglobin